jgi:hypothetical protein
VGGARRGWLINKAQGNNQVTFHPAKGIVANIQSPFLRGVKRDSLLSSKVNKSCGPYVKVTQVVTNLGSTTQTFSLFLIVNLKLAEKVLQDT